MSRLARKPIAIPSGVTVAISDGTLVVKGKGGERSFTLPKTVTITVDGTSMSVSPAGEQDAHAVTADLGMVWSLARNMVVGVSEGFQRILEFTGVGYTAQVAGDTLKMTLGFSHPIEVAIPKGLTVKVDKNSITISGNDKEAIGQWAANVRKIRPPEPYKGKGIRFSDEVIQRKEGKKAGATT